MQGYQRKQQPTHQIRVYIKVHTITQTKQLPFQGIQISHQTLAVGKQLIEALIRSNNRLAPPQLLMSSMNRASFS